MTARRVVMGYDPGIGLSGFGVVARSGPRLELVDGGTIDTPSDAELADRLLFIWGVLEAAVREHRPVAMGIENQLNVMVAARQAMIARIKSMLRGGRGAADYLGFNAANDGVFGAQVIAMSVCFAYRVKLVLLEPKAIKIGVLGPGGGNADKKDVKAAVLRRFPDAGRISSHAADGFAAAIEAERQQNLDQRIAEARS